MLPVSRKLRSSPRNWATLRTRVSIWARARRAEATAVQVLTPATAGRSRSRGTSSCERMRQRMRDPVRLRGGLRGTPTKDLSPEPAVRKMCYVHCKRRRQTRRQLGGNASMRLHVEKTAVEWFEDAARWYV